jgi:hypothetical protein
MPIDADVSWLITVSERMLSGDRLYVDILEVNPPASVWMYVPLVWLAQAVGARPEAVVVASFVAAALGSVFATVRLAARFDEAPRTPWLAATLSFVALVLPMALFAQREHAALLLALPALAALALVAEGKRVSKTGLCASGFAAGLIVVIKPPFALAIVAPAAWAMWKRRSVAPFLLPGAAAGAAMTLYGVAVIAFTPAYFDLLPIIAQTYAPMHNVLWKVIVGPTVFPAICLALAILARPGRVAPLAAAWGFGSAGFVLAAILQAKNYPNHWLPGTALAIAALLYLLGRPSTEMLRRIAVGAATTSLVAGAMYQWAIRPDPAVRAAVLRVAPPSPSVISLSPQLATGHPLTRNVGGRWVGSRAGLFTAAGARFVGLKDKADRDAYREDIHSFVVDVTRSSPDVVLVDKPSKAWLMREPAIARTMRAYLPAAAAGDTEVWVRRRGAR